MKYLVSRSFVQVVGNIWMPNTTAAMEYNLNQSDIDNMLDDEGNITRESVDNWLSSHAGDFRSITDFKADIELGNDLSVVIDWQDEENEITFYNCLYPMED